MKVKKMYRHILVATDLRTDQKVLLKKVQDLSSLLGNDLTGIHIVDPILQYSGGGYMGAGAFDLDGVEKDRMDQAAAKLKGFSEKFKDIFPDVKCCVDLGNSVSGIIDKANELKADLIIVGSHGKHGLGLLLGSTASGVVHHAKCDVIVVRLKN